MKAWEIIAYTYEAAFHCVACTEERFGEGVDNMGRDPKTDREGNEVRPVFASDEMDGDETCDECGGEIQ